MSAALVSYRRRGGRAPADDESLEVAEDGTFRARRTVAGARAGTFSGSLPARRLATLRRRLGAVDGAADASIPTPRDGATETVEAGGRRATLGSNESAPAPWGSLVQLLRTLVDDVTDSPAAGVELRADPDGATLATVGDGELELDIASAGIRLVPLAEDGVPAGRPWHGGAAADRTGSPRRHDADWVTAGPGWTMALPFEWPADLPAGGRVQVWVTLRVRQDGDVRDLRLFVPVRGATG